MASISFIYGLGNPGEEYRETRHNLGWMVVDLLVARCGAKWHEISDEMAAAKCRISTREFTLLRSNLYMNNSGKALLDIPELDPSSLLVICDDMSLPLGRIRIRAKGGSGSHRGLESIIYNLGTEKFARMRLGIGSPPPEITWTEFVLSRFLDEEIDIVRRMLISATEAVEVIAEKGLEVAMQVYNSFAKEDGD